MWKVVLRFLMAFDDRFEPQPFPAVCVLRVEENEYHWVIHRHKGASGWVDVLRSPMIYESWVEANDEGSEALLNLIRLGDL